MKNVYYVSKDGIPVDGSLLYTSMIIAMDAAFKLDAEEATEISAQELLSTYKKLLEIKKYLESDKFMTDIMVNKNDILLRLNA